MRINCKPPRAFLFCLVHIGYTFPDLGEGAFVDSSVNQSDLYWREYALDSRRTNSCRSLGASEWRFLELLLICLIKTLEKSQLCQDSRSSIRVSRTSVEASSETLVILTPSCILAESGYRLDDLDTIYRMKQ